MNNTNTNSVDENQTSHIPSSGSLKTSELRAAPSFTPGPWLTDKKCANWVDIATKSDGLIANVARWSFGVAGDDAENDDNARLIAAAPALYEALVAVVAIADRKTVEFDKARAALALVTTQETKSAEVGTGE